MRAGEYLLREEIRSRATGRSGGPTLAPGGWAFEYENDIYPDVDDVAVIALALRELGIGDDAVRRGLDWVAGMQSKNGGWGAFDVDNSAMWLYRIPFCDFGKVTDEPSADVTAHALEALAPEGVYGGAVERGLRFLLDEQEDDGSWFGRWGVNHIYGTGAALPALEACGIPHDHPAMRRAVALARLGPAGERRLRRGHPLVPRSGLARPRAVRDGVTDRVGAAGVRGRRKR